MMLTEAKLILAATVDHGAYVDGTRFERLLDLAQRSGLEIDEIYGDQPYFKIEFKEQITGIGAMSYVPVRTMSYGFEDELCSYKEDTDELYCEQGNTTVNKAHQKPKNGREASGYYFDR